MTDETKKKISEARKNQWKLGIYKNRKPPNAEHRQHMREARLKMKLRRGFVNSPEARAKMSIAFRGRHHTEEAKRKIGDACRGEKHYNWKGGLAFRKKKDERNDSAYNCWAKEVRQRDAGVCRLQNKNCMGYKVVHHILPWRDYPEERYNINNGITLCQYHHPRKRDDEQRLIPILQQMVQSNLKSL